MKGSLPFGIRYTSDSLDDELVLSVKMMNQFCMSKGSRFFFDTSDGNTFQIAGLRLMDLYGWIVPNSEAEDFEREWLDEVDLKDGDFGERWYRGIIWKEEDSAAIPVIL